MGDKEHVTLKNWGPENQNKTKKEKVILDRYVNIQLSTIKFL